MLLQGLTKAFADLFFSFLQNNSLKCIKKYDRISGPDGVRVQIPVIYVAFRDFQLGSAIGGAGDRGHDVEVDFMAHSSDGSIALDRDQRVVLKKFKNWHKFRKPVSFWIEGPKVQVQVQIQ